MTDRIKEPWGERTPFGPGEEWPVRVDQFLEQGLSEDDIDRWVQTASILHSNGDALDVAVKEGRIVGVRGRGVDRVNKGRVDPKDLFGWQANNAGDRMRKPLVRENGELVERAGTRQWIASSSARRGFWRRTGLWRSGSTQLASSSSRSITPWA